MTFFSYVSIFADLLGIIGFGLTIALLVKSEKIRNELIHQKTNYQQNHDIIRRKLISLRDELIENNEMSLKFRSNLRTELYQYFQNYKQLLSHKDRRFIKSTIVILDSDKKSGHYDRHTLISKLDYLIARFTKEER